MALNDIKEITIPEGNVKMIQNVNGDIIWGSQSAFPYRRLEYLNFTGNQYIDTGHYMLAGTYRAYISVESTSIWRYIFGTNNNGFRTFFQQNTDSKVGYRLKAIAAADTAVTVPLNTKLLYTFRNYATNNTKGTYWFAIDNEATSTRYIGQFYNNSTYAKNFNDTTQRNTISIGMNHYGNNLWGDANSRLKGKVYRFWKNEGDSASTKLIDAIPCQRKSDGVCGLYDTIANQFWPCLGTDRTDTAAGPIIDEYWDLTAPA